MGLRLGNRKIRMNSFVLQLLGLIFALFLVACGGGGGGGGGGASASAPSVSGQVIKGLTAGATVTLYSVSSTGSRTQIAVTTTDSSGNYSFPNRTLTAGQVYVIEATGGSYVDEISGVVTPLTNPLRAVVVGSASETTISPSPISEMAVADVENGSGSNKWSATSVTQSIDKVKTAFSLSSLHGIRYFDLATQPSGTANTMTEEQIGFSFYANMFAGFLHESKQRAGSATLTTAMQNFYSLMLTSAERDDLNSIFAAGFVKAVEKIPVLATADAKSVMYSLVGLPSNATSDVLSGGESSGTALETIPNNKLKLLDTSGYAFGTTYTDTIFNDRGALLAYRYSTWTHLGYSSVADVYGTSETAIGRWNGGYYFPSGVSYDQPTQTLRKNGALSAPLTSDKTYAAGIPATNLPQCGRYLMSLRGKTKGFTLSNGLMLTLDSASKISVQFVDGIPYVAHNIVLNGSNGLKYTVPTRYYDTFIPLDTPWKAPAVYSGMQFGSNSNNDSFLSLPGGAIVKLTGLLSGNGGKRAVIAITPYGNDKDTVLTAAAFEADTPVVECSDYVYAADEMSSLPATGAYWFSYSQDSYPWFWTNLSFFPNGSPNFPSAGLSATSSLEKIGNAQAGIGVLVPPFVDQSGGATVTTPTPYFYRQADSVAGWPSSGVSTYQMVAVTPTILSVSGVAISVKKSITSATLKVYLNQTTVGLYNNPQGTCELSLVDNGVQTLISTIYRTTYGICDGWPFTYGFEQFTGGITSGTSQYATVVYKNSSGGTATILFNRAP